MKLTLLLIAPLALALAACGDRAEQWKAEPKAAGEMAAEAGYLSPPMAVRAGLTDGDDLVVTGTAAPGAQVRLATPGGAAIEARADGDGLWQAVVEAAGEVRLFGLSMQSEGRTVQSEGYLMLAPDGDAAQLRAGTGSVRLAATSTAPRILSVDYDSDGGAVVSGIAAPGAGLGLRVDRIPRGETQADAKGRFSIALAEPLAFGSHTVDVAGEGGEDQLSIVTTLPNVPGPGPYRGERTAQGWRVDWMTPGGGAQTTLIFDRPGPAA